MDIVLRRPIVALGPSLEAVAIICQSEGYRLSQKIASSFKQIWESLSSCREYAAQIRFAAPVLYLLPLSSGMNNEEDKSTGNIGDR